MLYKTDAFFRVNANKLYILKKKSWIYLAQKVEVRLSFLRSMKTLFQRIRAFLPSCLAATAPRSEAVFSTLKLVGASNRKGKINYFVPYEDLK